MVTMELRQIHLNFAASTQLILINYHIIAGTFFSCNLHIDWHVKIENAEVVKYVCRSFDTLFVFDTDTILNIFSGRNGINR